MSLSAAVPLELDRTSDASRPLFPLWLKITYTAFLAVLVPYYWRAYSPWNFLYFCDVALLITGVALWTESRLLVSLECVAILLPQTFWVIDFGARAAGFKLLGMTDYMFNPSLPLFTRALSSFHGWLPFLLVYMLRRTGYDHRAYVVQIGIGLALIWACFFFAPMPPAPVDQPNLAVNVNYVWGPDDHHPQTWMPAAAWVMLLSGIFVAGIYTPTHVVLRKVFAARD